MSTAQALSLDGTDRKPTRLDNDELGLIYRRVDEIKRRITEGTLSIRTALGALQKIVENKAEALEPCRKHHRSAPLEFVRPPLKRRRLSLAPLRGRSKKYLDRLFFHYKLALQTGRHGRPAIKRFTPEDIMAMMWEAENIPYRASNYGRVPINTILDTDTPSKREVEIIADTLQWLGTNVGREFLIRYVRTADINI